MLQNGSAGIPTTPGFNHINFERFPTFFNQGMEEILFFQKLKKEDMNEISIILWKDIKWQKL